ncbi:MAG TPA: antibiotic biosynthesis monooxygenase [Rhodothermales bacterium]|nr:antibiotic biosynthesis monooxygenase [Bacteroidota bacterium]HRK74789.1 antibiotic biosynthesis monooxygenase [Rhodothermales bacterium]HRR07503.1 antibiotic biosynthesis monooxygenase [Rhodothermales bacterium]
MLIRIVRMTFRPETVPNFLTLFKEIFPVIRNMPGCRHLELWQDADLPEVFSTFSHWEAAEDLERYRQSEYFKATWARTKVLFDAPPLAWSQAKVFPVDLEDESA